MMENPQNANNKVAYFYNQEIGKFYYGKDHPMKPKRVAMTHSLIQQLGLYKHLDVYLARAATDKEMVEYHSEEYIKYLGNFISSDCSKILKGIGYLDFNEQKNSCFLPDEITDQERSYNIYNPKSQKNHKVGQITDCPGFNGLYNFCQMSAGASIDAAHTIINQDAHYAINWGGGLHHAKKEEASGFCYVNDIVLSILELLKYYDRVMYLDIDVHHGDGVEEAFFLTSRVMTVSFHQFGDDFFPGSGKVQSRGEGHGLNHSINVPLEPGITDDMYEQTFKRIMGECLSKFAPNVIILQCGADSLAYDKLGQFNLSTIGRGRCVKMILEYGVPVIILGGGGYNVPNVARTWTYETSIALKQPIQSNAVIPNTDQFYDSYNPDHKLHITAKNNFENKNSQESINKIEKTVLEYLREVEIRPGVAFHDIPASICQPTNDFLDDQNDKMDEEAFSQQIQKGVRF